VLKKTLRRVVRGGCFAAVAHVLSSFAAAQTDLTVDVLINSTNTQGYHSTAPVGEYQRYPERYLEHLQVPYRVIDVSQTPPASAPGLATTPLIIAGHQGLNLTSAWQQAIINAVQSGAGFVNLDWDTAIGSDAHMQAFFGCASSAAGTPGTAITLPATFLPDGASPHYITGLQKRFPIGNPGSDSGDLVYQFHQDDNTVLNTATSTICLDSQGHAAPGGTVLARIGNDALLTVTTFGSGNAVSFGTYDYLRADRFGFVMGLDDLFWRSLVWAARKPFVMRGHPRFFAVQEDDTVGGWGTRVQEMFNTTFTGNSTPEVLLDKSTINLGGPWKVTGNIITNDSDFTPGTAARQTVLDLVNAVTSFLRVTPQAVTGTTGGDLFWTCPCPPSSGGPLSDSNWTKNFNALTVFQIGNGPTGSNNGGNDSLSFAAHFTPHFWDLSDNTGTDLHSLGFRYITEIQQPNAYYNQPPPGKTPLQRLPGVRPFRLYEQPPAGHPVANPNELWSVYWADNYTVHSTVLESSAPVSFFGFATQLQGMSYPTYFAVWPNSPSIPDATALENWQAYIWRFWSGMAPVQIYTQDPGTGPAQATERQSFIKTLSAWMGTNGANENVNVFMDDLGAYLQARTQSTLASASLDTSGTNPSLTMTLTGNATDGVGNATNTYALIFLKDDDGNLVTVPGFSSSQSPFTTNPITLPALPVVQTNSTVSTLTNPSTFGAPVTFNASVTSTSLTKPTGSLSLFDGDTNIASASLDGNGNASFTTATLSAGKHAITTHYAGDATHLPSTSGLSISETVNRAPSSTALSGGGTASFFGNPITFNAAVTSTGGMPTGSVSLLDGATTVASAMLDGSGHAVLSVSTLTVGTHAISVSYGGDANFVASNSAAVNQTVNPADFSLSATGSPVTVLVGQSGTATITVTPLGTFGSAISFGCSGLPAESSCNFNPQNVTPNGAVVSITVTLSTTAPSAALHWNRFGRISSTSLAMLLPGFVGLILLGQRQKHLGKLVRIGAIVALVLTFSALISSCGGGGGGGGGGNGNPGTPRGTSTVVVTATSSSSGNVSHQISIMFTVQ
jgi:hypothetical protein